MLLKGKQATDFARKPKPSVWAVLAFGEDPGLASIDDYVEDSGEGRWTVEEAIANAVPAPAITAALFARFSSREDSSPAMKMVSALRHQFGGHATRPAK